MNNHTFLLVDNLLDNCFNNKEDSNYLINTIKTAFHLGSSNPHYAYPAFLYFKNNLEQHVNLENIKTNDINHVYKTLKIQAKTSFLTHHLNNSVLLPEEFKLLFTYFFDDLFIPNTHKYKKDEKNYYSGLIQYIKCAMHQNDSLFTHLINLLENSPNQAIIEDKSIFFSILKDMVDTYSIFQNKDQLISSLENKLIYVENDQVYFALKPNLSDKVVHKDFVMQGDTSLKKLYKVLDTIITPNEKHLKQQKLYLRNKTTDYPQVNQIINQIEKMHDLNEYLISLPFFKANLVKILTVGNMPGSQGLRNNFTSFSAICANSHHYFTTNAIDYTASYWLQDSINNNREEIFNKYNNRLVNQSFLTQLYNDFILCPHRNDLKVILFSHLDQTCVLDSIAYYKENKDSIQEFLLNYSKDKILYLDTNLKYLSHLLFPLQENPIVVYHALKLQKINDLLNDKTNKKYVCTDEEKNRASQYSIELISELKNIFNELKPFLTGLNVIPILCNHPQAASFDQSQNRSIPITTQQSIISLPALTINMFVNNYNYFCLNNTINNMNKNHEEEKPKKTLKI